MQNLKHVPYFYIIEHISSGIKYAGCRWTKKPTFYSKNGCNPIEFLKIDGYLTSSLKIKSMIKELGIESFKIIQILTQEECECEVYEYESKFLLENKIAESTKWFNKHDNTSISNGAIIGSKWYNNGIFEKQFFDLDLSLNPDWQIGRLTKSTKNKKLYNDGIKHYYYDEEDIIPENMKLGKTKTSINKTANTQRKLKVYNDGIREYHLDPKNTDVSNLHIGKLSNFGSKISKILTGGKWYNDGTTNIFIHDTDEIPSNFTKGKIKKDKTRKYKWYNNGQISIRLYDDEKIPDNFTLGIMPTECSKKMYNDGVTQKYFIENENPSNFILGMIPKTVETSKLYNDGIIEKYFKHNSNIPPEFKLGAIPNKQKRANVTGKKWYNDGIKEFYLDTENDNSNQYFIGRLKRTVLRDT